MPFPSIILALIFLGVGLYLISLIPMDETIRKVIRVVIILLIVLWIFGLFFPSAWGRWSYRAR